MKIGLIVGHKPNRPGACNKKHNICEYQFNDKLASDISDAVSKLYPEISTVIIHRRTYKTLPSDVNKAGPDVAISLHCNAFNGKWNGTEVLYYHRSKKGKAVAEILQKNLLAVLGFRDRGTLPRSVEDRGGTLLKYTHMPCVIAEPFFIDNNSAYEEVINKYDSLVAAYTTAIGEISNLIKEK